MLTAAVLVVAACGAGGGASPTKTATLSVVTTTTVFADIVRNVGGRAPGRPSIIPPGVGPEDYEPRPDDAKTLALTPI